MSIIDLSIMIFIFLEMANVYILLFSPDSRLGNGVAVFKHWELSKRDESMHMFARYLTYWVAGTKLIFIFLLIVILLTASDKTKVWTNFALIISIASYYWKLHPIILKMDSKGEIIPKGYSKTLGFTIACFLIMFSIALGVQLVSFIS